MAPQLTRAAALILALTLGAAGWAECVAPQTASQTQMACCRDNPSCPMHDSSEPGSTAHRAMSASETAACCTASGAGDSTPPASAFLIPLSSTLAPVPTASAALIAVPAPPAGRPDMPLPPGHVARHILLSVFLI